MLAHNIRSLYNVGSIFRIADVFAVDKLYLSGYTGHPPDEKLAKVSLGAEHTVPWEYKKSSALIIKQLRQQYPKLRVIGLENNLSESKRVVQLHTFMPKFPVLLVLGEEVKGISPRLIGLCDFFVEIPQFGEKESLNVSVAFGIAAYSIRMNIK